jgi:hypothetical protein
LGTTALGSKYTTRRNAIQNLLGQVDAISNTEDHPNQQVIDAIDERTVEVQEDVGRAWTYLYQVQRQNNPLPEILSPGFKQAFLETPEDDDLDWEYRNDYMNFIGDYIPQLLEMGDIIPPVAQQAGARTPGAPGFMPGPVAAQGESQTELSEDDATGVVLWSSTDWQAVQDRFVWDRPPSTLALRMAQEDLWVYEALMKIIKRTNGPVKNSSDATIKEIYALRIGNAATAAWGTLDSGQEAGGQGVVSTGLVSSVATGTINTEFDELMLQEGRYIDTADQPLTSEVEGPFKLMPIYLELRIDQRKVSRLLVECANSSMPVEARKVSLITAETGVIQTRRSSAVGSDGLDATIRLRGRICIYNPPDPDMPGVKEALEEFAALSSDVAARNGTNTTEQLAGAGM